jgi:hypothetical protein
VFFFIYFKIQELPVPVTLGKNKNQRIANSSYFLKIKETTYFFMKEPIKRIPVLYMGI